MGPFIPRNKQTIFPNKNAGHGLFLFYQLRYEKGLFSGFPKSYQNKLQEEGVQNITNIKKIKFEQNVD